MTAPLEQFGHWIRKTSDQESYFSGTFWLLFSALSGPDFARVLDLRTTIRADIPDADSSTSSTFSKRTGKILRATFWHLPIRHGNVHVLFSLEKPSQAARPLYRLLAKTRGKVNLFPLGHPLVKDCVRLDSKFAFEDTHVMRAVSYPSRPNDGGADINLKPGNASVFFTRLEDEKRVLKSARLCAPTSKDSTCEFTVGRSGYLSYHKGDFRPFLRLISERLPEALADSVRPFESARGRFVEFNFPEPLFVDRSNFTIVTEALSRIPRSSLALLHTNPYFHATLTNYEDGGEFDIFITGHSTISIQGATESSPAAFLRVQNGLTEQFRDARVTLEDPKQFSLRELMEGKV